MQKFNEFSHRNVVMLWCVSSWNLNGEPILELAEVKGPLKTIVDGDGGRYGQMLKFEEFPEKPK